MHQISLVEGAKILRLTYNCFYLRLHNPRFDYPKIHYADGKPFLFQEECERVREREIEFYANHISLKEASKKIFGNARTLLCIYYYRPYCFLPPVVNYGKSYLKRADFDDFFERICSGKRLVRFKHIIAKIGIPNRLKLYYFLQTSGFYSEVKYYIFSREGRKYYNLDDVNKWLAKNRLPIIRGYN